jgi:hypothetical protein
LSDELSRHLTMASARIAGLFFFSSSFLMTYLFPVPSSPRYWCGVVTIQFVRCTGRIQGRHVRQILWREGSGMVPPPITMERGRTKSLSLGHRRRNTLFGSMASTRYSVRLPYQAPGKLTSARDRTGSMNIEVEHKHDYGIERPSNGLHHTSCTLTPRHNSSAQNL